MNKKFHLGKTFDGIVFVSYIVLILTGGLFYFIYKHLFPGLNTGELALAVAAMIVLMIIAVKKVMDYAKRTISYTVTDKALVMNGLFGKVTKYEWNGFQQVYMAKLAPYEICRVRFTYYGRELKILKYTENPNGLCMLIFKKIQDHVQIDPEILKTTRALSD